VIGIFDCCREKVPPKKVDIEKEIAKEQAQAEKAKAEAKAKGRTEIDIFEDTNCLFVYGCAPTYGVSMKSDIAGDLLRWLRDNQCENKVVLPNALVGFTGDPKIGTGEVLARGKAKIILRIRPKEEVERMRMEQAVRGEIDEDLSRIILSPKNAD